MNSETQTSTRIFGLDVVRATAIILVLLSHLYYLVDANNPTIISLSGLAGYTGVELFFVLSGFLIGTILLKKYISGSFQLKEVFSFLKRRWLRTLPNYYFILIINIILGISLGYTMTYIWKYFLFLQNFNSYSISFFSESWSLSVEEWTYLLVPFVLLIAGYKAKNRKYTFLGVIISLILLIHYHRYLYFTSHTITDMDTWNKEVKSIVIFRIDTILAGFIVAWLNYFYSQKLKKISFYLFILAGHLFFFQFIAMNVLGYDIISSPLYFLVFYFTLSTVIFSLILPTFINWKSEKGIVSKVITQTSKLSYSMYLIHYSLLSVMVKNFFSGLNNSWIIAVYIFAVIFFSYILYRFIEKPIMDWRDKN